MKIIFLDIDGVLCNRASLMTLKRIVISSTWRKYHTSQDIAAQLRRHGLRHGRLHDDWRTSVGEGIRGDEIAEWLSAHPEVTAFVILDDDSDFREEQLSRHVRTSFEPGFTRENLDEALALFVS